MGNINNKTFQRIYTFAASVLVVHANPVEPADSADQNVPGTSEPSSDAHTDSSKSDDSVPSTDDKNNNTKHSVSKDSAHEMYPASASSSGRWIPQSPTYEHRALNEEPRQEYGVKGPPNLNNEYALYNSDSFESSPFQSQDLCRQNFSTNNQTSETTTHHVPSQLSTLSTDDLSVDARACRAPRRLAQRSVENDGGESKTAQKEHRGIDVEKAEAKEKYEKHDTTETKLNDTRASESEIFDLISQLVAKEVRKTRPPQVFLFDAAVLYDRKDYEKVIQFLNELRAIVKSEIEDLRIELYDSEHFTQSSVMVVDDVMQKCSIILVYLTENCTSESFKLFCDEAIGLSRLGLNNPDIQAGRIRNERQWVVKPVHTLSQKERYYKTPIGLLTVNGIDWYDKWSTHTRNRVVSIMRDAVAQRQGREISENTKRGYAHAMDMGKASKTPSRGSTNINNERALGVSINQQVREAVPIAQHHSIASVDAQSFMSQQHTMVNPQLAQNTAFPAQFSVPLYFQGTNAFGHVSNVQMPTPGMQQNPVSMQNYAAPSQNYGANQFDQRYSSTLPQYQQYEVQSQTPIVSNQQSPYQNQAYTESPPPYTSQPLTNQQQPPYGYHVGSADEFLLNNPPSRQVLSPACVAQRMNTPLDMSNPRMYDDRRHGSAQGTLFQTEGLQTPNPAPYTQSNGVPFSQNAPNPYQPQQSQHIHNATVQSNQHPTGQRFDRSNPNSGSVNVSNFGNYMRDQRNDAPPSSELAVVSRVSGHLIINPNLSTDDIEIDNSSSVVETRTKSKDNGSGHRRTKHHAEDSDDSSESSDDSDTEVPIRRSKTVNIVRCSHVQLGNDNKIVERTKKKKTKKISSLLKPKLESTTTNVTEKSQVRATPEQRTSISITDHNQNRHSREHSSLYEDNISCSIERNLSGNVENKPLVSKTKAVSEALVDENKETNAGTSYIPNIREFQTFTKAKSMNKLSSTPLEETDRRKQDSNLNVPLNNNDEDNDNTPSPTENISEDKLFDEGINKQTTGDCFMYSRRRQQESSFGSLCSRLRLEPVSPNTSDAELD